MFTTIFVGSSSFSLAYLLALQPLEDAPWVSFSVLVSSLEMVMVTREACVDAPKHSTQHRELPLEVACGGACEGACVTSEGPKVIR